jgi:hypothetical protein
MAATQPTAAVRRRRAPTCSLLIAWASASEIFLFAPDHPPDDNAGTSATRLDLSLALAPASLLDVACSTCHHSLRRRVLRRVPGAPRVPGTGHRRPSWARCGRLGRAVFVSSRWGEHICTLRADAHHPSLFRWHRPAQPAPRTVLKVLTDAMRAGLAAACGVARWGVPAAGEGGVARRALLLATALGALGGSLSAECAAAAAVGPRALTSQGMELFRGGKVAESEPPVACA